MKLSSNEKHTFLPLKMYFPSSCSSGLTENYKPIVINVKMLTLIDTCTELFANMLMYQWIKKIWNENKHSETFSPKYFTQTVYILFQRRIFSFTYPTIISTAVSTPYITYSYKSLIPTSPDECLMSN